MRSLRWINLRFAVASAAWFAALCAAATVVPAHAQIAAGGPGAAPESASAPAPATRQARTTRPAAELPPIRPVTVYTKASAPFTPKPEDLPLVPSVSQYGITWTFDQPARAGQFLNGDWYVVGPVTVKMIDPRPLWGEEVKDPVEQGVVHEGRYAGRLARNGSTLNLPALAPRGRDANRGAQGVGFDSRILGGCYDPDQFTQLPIAMKPGDSLVSTVSYRNEEIKSFAGNERLDFIKTAAVLTCVAAPLPADAFRPSYCDTAGSKIHLSRNLRRELLANLAPPKARLPRMELYVRAMERPWIDTVNHGFASPRENFPMGDNGYNLAAVAGTASLLLLIDQPADQKEPLLVNMVQTGIDLWGLVRGGRSWSAFGGQSSGRKWPIVLAGTLLGDEEMAAPGKKYPKTHFGEDDQTALCPYTFDGKTYERGWTGARAIFTGHTPQEAGPVRWEDGRGPIELLPPSEWPKGRMGEARFPVSEGYRRMETSIAWVGEALAARILHAEKAWGHDAFFAYVDRWMTEDDAAQLEEILKAGGPDYRGIKPLRQGRQGATSSEFVAEMWAKYRDSLPPWADGTQTPPAGSTWK